jgi:hypothetical protein
MQLNDPGLCTPCGGQHSGAGSERHASGQTKALVLKTRSRHEKHRADRTGKDYTLKLNW